MRNNTQRKQTDFIIYIAPTSNFVIHENCTGDNFETNQ